MRSHRKALPSHRGSILVAVLGMVALMAALMISFLSEATERIKYSGLMDERADVRTVAYSAMEITLAVMNEIGEIDEDLYSPTQGWNNPMAYSGINLGEGYDITVEFEDESSKFSLSKISRNELMMLFEEMDLDLMTADKLTDCLLDWMDDDDYARLNGFDGEDYEDRDPPYRAANAVPQSWEEFRLIEQFDTLFWDEAGQATPQFAAFKSAVSLYNTGSVNLNTANTLVIRTLARMAGFNPDMLEERMAGYDRIRGTMDDELIKSAEDLMFDAELSNTAYKASLIQVRVTVSYGDAKFLLTTLVTWEGYSPSAGLGGNAGGIPSNGSSNRRQTTIDTGSSSLSNGSAGGDLSYPFKITRIIENQRL